MKRLAVALVLSVALPLHAAAGLWLPRQLPGIESALRQAGIAVDPKQLADPARYPWNAVVRLGDGCAASLVSSLGLILTSRDCARGAIEAAAAAGRELREGFVAPTLGEELPGGPGLHAEILDSVSDVSADMRGSAGVERDAATLAAVGTQLVAACQADPAYRCSIDAVDDGASYWLVRRLQLRDLRLVYLPAAAAIDAATPPARNVALFRAYVGPDAQAADFSESNVPYRPAAYLRLQGAGGKAGDFVFAAGYPADAADASLRVAYGRIQVAAASDAPAAVVEAGAAAAPAAAAPGGFRVDLDAIGAAGGPLLNARAELVGVAVAEPKAAPAGGAVDVRHLLWQLQAVAGAQGLLRELGIPADVPDA